MSWSDKYKKSIDCDNPKGFSQKAHCQGRKKKLSEEGLRDWFGKSKSKDGKPGWVNVVTGGTCASDEPGEGTPKCVSSEKRASMTPAERRSASRRKKAADPGQQKKSSAAKPTYVSTDKPKKMNEESDIKGKSSGKKDACYKKVKSRYDVWPSAYASGALVKCRKVGASNWGTKSEEKDHEYSMARSEISTIIAAAKRLKKKMGKGEGNLEAWVQSKITKAADYLDTAADYVSSGEQNENYDYSNWRDDFKAIEIESIDLIKPDPIMPTESFYIDPKKHREQQRAKKIRDRTKTDDEGSEIAKKKVKGPALFGEEKKDPCWDGYKQVGMKKKGSKVVPNCVKENEEINEIHKQGHSPHEVPSADFKKLVKKASKRIDTDADGDTDIEDKPKGESGKYATNIKSKKIYNVDSLREVPKKNISSYEIPSGNLKSLVAKAVKRIDTDADGDTDHNDKAKGELGEFIPGVNNKRLYSTTRTKTAKESFSNWREELDIEEGAAWTKKSGKSEAGGLNEKGRKSYERENPGSDLKAPSKKVGNPRRASFCARMSGMKAKLTSKKTANDPDSRINKSLRAWNC